MLVWCNAAQAATFYTRTTQGQVNTWASIWTNATQTTGVAPTAGNTYEAVVNATLFGASATGGSINNTRVRNPYGTGAIGGVQTFPGDSLTLNTNSEFRFKNVGGLVAIEFPGVAGNPGLFLNGGVMNTGDNIVFLITGLVHVASTSYIVPADNGAGAITPQRAFNFWAQLTGAAPLIIAQAGTQVAQEVSSVSNAFSGGWVVKCGWLKGTGVESLGSGDITIDPSFALAFSGGSVLSNGPAQLELMYDINSPGKLTLRNGGTMILHQDCTFAAVTIEGTDLSPSPGTHPYAELAAAFPNNFAPNGSGSITINPSTNAPPFILDLAPARNAAFYPAANGVSFRAFTVSPNSISSQNLKLFLNGVDVSAGLSVSGTPTEWSVSYGGLSADVFYSATIIAADDFGRITTNSWNFNTLQTADVVVVEAEDYNYGPGSDNCSAPVGFRFTDGIGGGFIDNPLPGAYTGLIGLFDIDYRVPSPNNTDVYRCGLLGNNAVGTRVSLDTPRTEFTTAGVPENDVSQVQAGEWLNYTRLFPAANYGVHLRAASSAAQQQVRLDKVTSDTTTSNQTTAALGTFLVPNTGGAYQDVPLTDVSGSNVLVRLLPGTTLRLISVNGNNMAHLNYLVFLQSGQIRPPAIASISPAANATGVLPDAALGINIANGDSIVNTSTIVLRFNGIDVTGGAIITTPTPEQVSVSYDPPGFLVTNTVYAVNLVFADDVGTFYTNQWSFTTIPSIPIIPASYATALGSASDTGFNLKVRKAPNTAPAGSFPNSILRAEQHLADQIIDSATGLAFVNEAAGPNGDGTFVEPGVINYEQGALDAGYFTGVNGYPEAPFPGIPAGTPNFISLAAVTYLELTAGVHRFGVRSDDNFKLTAGPLATDTNLVLGLFDAGGRADAPTEFDFLAEADGVYAFRLVYEEGSGGASLEWYSVDRGTGARTLINDSLTPTAVKAFRTRASLPPGAPPQISGLQPANNTFYHPAANGISFTATTAGGNSLAPANLHLTLNGTDVSASLLIGGNAQSRTVAFGGLAPNAAYDAQILVTDNNGISTTVSLRFDTFVQAQVVIIEAEDYNYDPAADNCSIPVGSRAFSGAGGGFIDNPLPGAYADKIGLFDIDYHVPTPSNTNVYRCALYGTNDVGTRISLDTTRPEYTSAGVPERDVSQLQAGEWLNYSRSFVPGTYNVFLRVSSSAARRLRLDLVTGDATTFNQTTFASGVFRVPNTGGSQAYQYVPLTDLFGNPVIVNLAAPTIRLTALEAANDVHANFLVLAPTAAPAPAGITDAYPAPGAANVPVDALVNVTIANGSTTVVPGSIQLSLDGVNVTADAVIANSGLGATINFTPPTFFATGSVHTVSVVCSDSGANTISNQWSFTIAPVRFGASVNVNFAAGAGNTAGNPVAPVPLGYVQDIGEVFEDRGNGYSYGWDRNIVGDGRYRQAANSPDLRYDTFMHLIKATPPAVWEIALPDGPYQAHIVAGDPSNTDSVFQFDVEGALTATVTPGGPGSFNVNWADFTVTCVVSDGRLTVRSGPNSQTTANNNKIGFIDITRLNPPVALSISRQPQSQSVAGGGNVTFRVSVRGTDPLSYQWRYNGTDLNGETNAMLTINNAQSANQGSYDVVVANSVNSATSSPATLTVTSGGQPPAITAQPQDIVVQASGTANFSVTATGALTYQWRFNGGDLGGQTSSTLTINNVQSANVGNYSVVVANTSGSVTSIVASLQLLVPPAIPITSASYNGTTFTLGVTTQSGVNYVVEYKDNLNDATWSLLPGGTVAGDGTVKPVPDNTANGASRFYRIRVQ